MRFEKGMSGDVVRQASIRNARNAIAIDPSTTTARCALIRIFRTTGQAEEGLKEATILRKSGATDAASLAATAEAYEQAGMPDRAIPIFEQALRMDPEEPSVPGRLALAAYWVGQHRRGQQVLQTQLQKEGAPLAELNLAVATGQRAKARSVGPGNLEDRSSLLLVAFSGFILRDIGEGDHARRILRERLPACRARMADVQNERGQIALGLIYSILGDKSHAHEQEELALEVNPGDPWMLFFSSEIEAELGEDRQAIDRLQRSLARGFLAQHYLDWPHGPLYRLRTNPEVGALRATLASRIASLRKRY
jgi:tetratricopeptide (TPR) repeat protein